MREKCKLSIFILFFLAFILQPLAVLEAQEIPVVRLILSPSLQQGLQVVYISDLDLLEQGVADYFFDVEIWNVIQDWEETRLILNVKQDGVAIASAVSDRFTLWEPDPPTGEDKLAYSASNIDLMNAGTFQGSNIHLHFSDKNIDLPDDSFEEYLGKSGKLERGRYTLEAVLENAGWGSGDVRAELVINVLNPSTINLQSPANQEVVITEFPFFQYESDATDFVVYVCKKLHDEDDIETVLAGHPTLEYSTNQKQFSYIVTGGDPLESGATYYWYVKALVYTSNGLEEFNSEIWRFTVSTEGEALSALDLRELLEPLLGAQAEGIADKLTGYELETITLNGKAISLQELYRVIDSYQGAAFEVKDLELR